MAAKKVDLGPGLQFASIGEAQEYFDNILKSGALDQTVSKADFDALKLLYEAYCTKTDWKMPAPPKAFFPTYEQQKGYTTRCFGIEFQNGEKNKFSLRKALTAIAN